MLPDAHWQGDQPTRDQLGVEGNAHASDDETVTLALLDASCDWSKN
jgi:hypothetical protein